MEVCVRPLLQWSPECCRTLLHSRLLSRCHLQPSYSQQMVSTVLTTVPLVPIEGDAVKVEAPLQSILNGTLQSQSDTNMSGVDHCMTVPVSPPMELRVPNLLGNRCLCGFQQSDPMFVNCGTIVFTYCETWICSEISKKLKAWI